MELAELRSQFKKAYEEICGELKLKSKRVQYKYETPNVGVTYYGGAKSKDYSIELQLDTYTTGTLLADGRTHISLSIEYSEDAPAYRDSEDITSLKGRNDFLVIWARNAINRFRKWYRDNKLDVLFHDMVLRVYGQPGYTNPTMTEFRLLIGGLIASQTPKKTLVYRFHHYDEDTDSESFSYAFLANTLTSSSSLATHQCWIFFPDAAGESGGTNYQDLLTIEELLQSLERRIKTEIRDIDVEYDTLEDYLLENAEGFGMRTIDINYLQKLKSAGKNNVFVLCEGPTDSKYINKFAEKLGCKEKFDKVSPLFIPLHGKKDIELELIDRINAEPVPFVLIQDRDENKNEEYIRKLTTRFGEKRVHIWKRREIENYALDYAAILAVLKDRGLKKPAIKDRISNLTLADIVSAVWSLAQTLKTKTILMQFVHELVPNRILSYEEMKAFIERNCIRSEEATDEIINDFSRNLLDRIVSLNSNNLKEKLHRIRVDLSNNWNETGILQVCPGKDLLEMINRWALKEFDISISGYDLIRYQEKVHPEVKAVVNKIIDAGEAAR